MQLGSIVRFNSIANHTNFQNTFQYPSGKLPNLAISKISIIPSSGATTTGEKLLCAEAVLPMNLGLRVPEDIYRLLVPNSLRLRV